MARTIKTATVSTSSGTRPVRSSRPTRQATMAVMAYVENDLDVDMDEDEENENSKEEEEEEEEPSETSSSGSEDESSDYGPKRKASTKAPPAKRAKTESSSTKASKSPVKAKGKQKKSLSLLPTMPLDILFEILSHLSPKDIISVSRTSKIFRTTLIAPSATTVWKTARERDEAPSCPTYLKEPPWAVLLYGNLCQACGAKNIQKVDFLIMRRVCTNCKKNHLVVKSRFKTRFPDNEVSVLDVVPYTHTGGWAHGYSSKSHFYWDKDIDNAIHKLTVLQHGVFMRFPDAKGALDEYRAEQVARITHSQENFRAWNRWVEGIQDRRARDKYDVQQNRIEEIKRRFIELGYSNADVSFLNTHGESAKRGVVTDRIWQRLRTEFEPRVLINKNNRLEREHGSIRNSRRRIVDDRYNDFKRTLPPSQWKYLPRTLDICAFEPFARHVEASPSATITLHDFDEAFGKLPELLSTLAQTTKEILRAALPALSPLEPGELRSSAFTVDPLDLATSVFECALRPCRQPGYVWDYTYIPDNKPLLFGWDDVAIHHCQNEAEGLSLNSASTISNAITPQSHICLSLDASKAAQRVIKLVGLDPASATVDEMDKNDARFTCTACAPQKVNNIWTRFGYTWRTMVSHIIFEGRHAGVCDFVLLSAANTITVKQIELEDAKWVQQKWLCARCPEHLNNLKMKTEVVEHLRNSHAIAVPNAPTDYFFFERYFTHLRSKPKYQVDPPVGWANPGKANIRCLRCKHGSAQQRDRLFVHSGVVSHLKDKHKILAPQVNVDYLAT